MNNFTAALAAIHRLKSEGVVKDYAIGGAMALAFWSEPIPTFDLDVFVDGARRSNYREEEAEHIFIAGMPVQFIPAHNALAEEAIATAAELDFEGQPVRVIRPAYLIALYLEPSAREALRQGKRQLRTSRRNLTLAEKLDQVVELQRTVLPLIRRRRALKPWERVWELRVREWTKKWLREPLSHRSLSRRVDIHKGAFAPMLPS